MPPRLAATLLGYIAQVRLSLRAAHDGPHRRACCASSPAGSPSTPPTSAPSPDLRRAAHRGLQASPGRPPLGPRRAAVQDSALAEHLGILRTCFERLTEWDGDDVPARCWSSPATCRCATTRCPASSTTPRSTKLLQAARADADPFVRLCVEFLARTGMRKGEFLRPHRRLGGADRRRLLAARPGRQAAQRPLHPAAPAAQGQLLDDWIATRPAGLREPLPAARVRPPRRPRTGSTGPSPRPHEPRASATSPRISCATPWPPKRSTGACRWRPSPPCWGIARCG